MTNLSSTYKKDGRSLCGLCTVVTAQRTYGLTVWCDGGLLFCILSPANLKLSHFNRSITHTWPYTNTLQYTNTSWRHKMQRRLVLKRYEHAAVSVGTKLRGRTFADKALQTDGLWSDREGTYHHTSTVQWVLSWQTAEVLYNEYPRPPSEATTPAGIETCTISLLSLTHFCSDAYWVFMYTDVNWLVSSVSSNWLKWCYVAAVA